MTMQAWTVKDGVGTLLPRFVRCDRFDVEKLVLPVCYEHNRLLTEPSYRREFDQHVKSVLDQEGWKIVPIAVVELATSSRPEAI
jgi:hypothetical protein